MDEFFATLPRDGLPRWVGELYLELHRGTLTTQAKVKKLNREGEHRLMEAEAFSTLAALRGYEYPGEELERLWKVLLLNQFHDILPGTSISEVYEDTHRELEEVVNSAKKLRDRALHHLSERDWAGGEVFVVNTALHFRPVTVMIPGDPDSSMSALDAEGNALPVQQTEDGLLVHAPDQRVPGLGWTNLRLENPGAASPAKQAGVRVEEAETRTVIENDLLRVEIGQDGSLDRVYDREMDREVLHGRGNRIVAYADKPAQWDAWDVQEGYELEGEEIPGATKVEVVEDGPLRVSVRVERRWRDSSVVQTYRLLSDSRRLDIETHVDWHERQVLLRAVFPLNVRSHEATFETMYGVVKRPTHQNTSWDATRFEVCGHRFADLSEPGYGAALLNDGKYGHSTKDNVLGISLLRSPLYPDPFADEGEHHFTYSLFPHPGGWAEGGVVDESLYLNSPLFVVAGYPTDTDVTGGFVTLEGVKLGLGSLKLAEDRRGVILRLYEPHGARGRCALRFVSRLENAERVNLLEEPEGEPVEVDGNVVRLGVRPFEVVTLRLNLGTGRIAGNSPKGEGMEHRRLGRTGRENSVLIFGGAALGEVTEEAADRAISQALEAGIDHFDTAADYGDSELQYGRWMPEIRDRIFLSTKTGDREKDAAKRSIHNSLERLRVDNVDLIQLHAVGDIEDLDRATGSGGALEAALEARDEGLVGAVGITGHGHEAPATHLEALRRYPFDTVLTPWNYVLSTDENYRRDFEALAEEVQLQETGLMIIKTISRRNWTDGDPLESQRRATWYEPFEEQEYIDAAVSFVLARQEITGIAMAGDVGLVPATIEAERNRMPLEKAEETLANAPNYSSPFISMPF
ncbi:MAG: aldo/keto reductase [Rubrobacteraceae bacterium]